MKYIQKHIYAFPAFLLSWMMLVTSCINDDLSVAGAGEEVTVKLSASTRATDDPLIRDNDDHFGSLAVYAFDENGNFLRLYTFAPSAASNTYTTDAFNCGIGVKTLYAIANYAAYPDFELKVLNYNAVKAQVANAAGTTALGADNILMVGEVTGLAFSKPDDQDENISVNISLKRLAARVDVFVLKEAGWAADVKVTKVEFSGGVKNTKLAYQEGVVNLPEPLNFDVTQTFSGASDTPLETFEGENALIWQQDQHLRGSFYTYRTVQPQTSSNVPKLAITVKVSDNIEKTYTAIIADKGTDSDTSVTLDAGNVYRICAIMTKTGLVIEMQVADWEGAPVYNLDFSYPTYQNPLTPWGGTAETPYEQPTVYYNPDGNSTEGTVGFSFSLTAPSRQSWRATLLDATEADFEVKVYQKGIEIENPVASAEPFEIRVRALKPENVGKTVKLGIAFTPAWDPLSSSLLMINGSSGAPAWGGSEGETDPTVIVIKQIERPL